MTSVWELIESGRYAEACEVADNEYATEKDLFPLRNKVLALLCLGQPDQVVALDALIIKENKGSTDSDFIFQGVAYWLLGHHGDAVSAWRGATHCMYRDAAGGVEAPILLHYAGIRLGDKALTKESLKLLKAKCRKSVRSWPAPLAGYHLGLLSQDDVLAAIDTNESLRAKQQCQAFFNFGVLSLADGDTGKALSHFGEATSKVPVSLMKHEYYLAKHEERILITGAR